MRRFVVMLLAIASLVLPLGCSDSSAMVRQPSTHTSQVHADKNAIWWEVERSNSEIVDLMTDERFHEEVEVRGLSIEQFAAKLGREVREPIARRHGMTYEELMQLFRDGLSAPWLGEDPRAGAR